MVKYILHSWEEPISYIGVNEFTDDPNDNRWNISKILTDIVGSSVKTFAIGKWTDRNILIYN